MPSAADLDLDADMDIGVDRDMDIRADIHTDIDLEVCVSAFTLCTSTGPYVKSAKSNMPYLRVACCWDITIPEKEEYLQLEEPILDETRHRQKLTSKA